MVLDLYKTIDAIVDAYNVELPEFYKRRDRNEPLRAEKEAWEDKLYKAVRARFRTQLRQLEEHLTRTLPQKNIDNWMRYIDEPLKDPKNEKRILKIFLGMLSAGIQWFAMATEIQVDWTQVNDEAAKWADKWTTEFLTDLDSVTKDKIRTELGHFVSQEAYTLGDVVSGLRQTGLDDMRAMRIAVTEVTRTFSESDQIAGEAIASEYPDVRVIKTWFTNADDKVCPICGPLNNMSVLVKEQFPGGFDGPPAHPNCRCWRSTRTDITGSVELG